MSSLPVPSLCYVIYCHRTGSPDIGAARGAEVCGDSKPGRKQAAPGAACWKKKTGDQSEPWPPPACCAAAIPEPGSADAAL